MGRVRRYKKYKSCDPFSKKSKAEVDTVHDEPPEIFDDRVRNDRKRKERMFDDEDYNEILLQRDAMRTLKEEEEKLHKHEKVIEGKRQDETMKDFKQRIRQETRITLRDELKGMTATAKKRKERLKDRKTARKLEKNGIKPSIAEEEVLEFNMASNGHLRSSDLGGTSSFETHESVRFGERYERPPDLQSLMSKIKKKKTVVKGESSAGQHRGEDRASDEIVMDGHKRVDKDHTGVTSSSSNSSTSGNGPTKKNKKSLMKTLSDNLDVDDSSGGISSSNASVAASGQRRDGILYAGSGGAKATASEMEALRLKVQAAYRDLKLKRHAKSGVSSFIGLGVGSGPKQFGSTLR